MDSRDFIPFPIPKEEAQKWGRQALDIAIAAREARLAAQPLVHIADDPADLNRLQSAFEELETKARQLLVEMTMVGIVPVDPMRGDWE